MGPAPEYPDLQATARIAELEVLAADTYETLEETRDELHEARRVIAAGVNGEQVRLLTRELIATRLAGEAVRAALAAELEDTAHRLAHELTRGNRLALRLAELDAPEPAEVSILKGRVSELEARLCPNDPKYADRVDELHGLAEKLKLDISGHVGTIHEQVERIHRVEDELRRATESESYAITAAQFAGKEAADTFAREVTEILLPGFLPTTTDPEPQETARSVLRTTLAGLAVEEKMRSDIEDAIEELGYPCPPVEPYTLPTVSDSSSRRTSNLRPLAPSSPPHVRNWPCWAWSSRDQPSDRTRRIMRALVAHSAAPHAALSSRGHKRDADQPEHHTGAQVRGVRALGRRRRRVCRSSFRGWRVEARTPVCGTTRVRRAVVDRVPRGQARVRVPRAVRRGPARATIRAVQGAAVTDPTYTDDRVAEFRERAVATLLDAARAERVGAILSPVADGLERAAAILAGVPTRAPADRAVREALASLPRPDATIEPPHAPVRSGSSTADDKQA